MYKSKTIDWIDRFCQKTIKNFLHSYRLLLKKSRFWFSIKILVPLITRTSSFEWGLFLCSVFVVLRFLHSSIRRKSFYFDSFELWVVAKQSKQVLFRWSQSNFKKLREKRGDNDIKTLKQRFFYFIFLHSGNFDGPRDSRKS